MLTKANTYTKREKAPKHNLKIKNKQKNSKLLQKCNMPPLDSA